jgi:hypothetical protein
MRFWHSVFPDERLPETQAVSQRSGEVLQWTDGLGDQ